MQWPSRLLTGSLVLVFLLLAYACASRLPRDVESNPAALAHRTTPLKGLFVREKGGFYHDGRFEDLTQVVAHYSRVLNLSLSDSEKADLVQFLKSL